MTIPLDVMVKAGTSLEFRDLIWGEFFVSRHRGKALDLHAPYLTDRHAVRSVVAEDESGIVGGLVIKDFHSCNDIVISMFGFVCVRPDRRGQHISRTLLNKAIDDAKTRAIGGVVLWSATPQVYAHAGFEHDSRDVFFLTCQLKETTTVMFSSKPTVLSSRGMPPFAKSAVLLESDQASATILYTADGPVLAEWCGSDNAVIDLIGTSVKSPIWINAQSCDTLPGAVQKHNGAAPLKYVQSKRLALALDQFSITDLSEVRILDRI